MCNASRHGGRYTEPRESREKGSLRIGETLTAGRKALTEILKSPREGALPIALSENIDTAPVDLIRIVRELGLEGVVAKRKDSVYESGKRTGAWVKYKVNRGQEFVIRGFTTGNPLDAVIVGYYNDEKLLYASKVRNGFVPQPPPPISSELFG